MPRQEAARISVSASATRARMFERIVSRPVQTAFVAVEIDVSCALSVRTISSCSRMAVRAAAMAAGSTSTSCSASEASGQETRQANGRLERGGLRGVRVDDAVDVIADHVERRDPGRGVLRGEDDQPDRSTTVLLRLAQLVADRAHRHRPVLGLDHDPQVAAARHPRVERQHEVALLRLHERPGLRAGPVQQVAGAPREVAEHRLEEVLEVGALCRRLRPLGATRRRGRLDRHEPLLERLEPRGDLLAELVHRRVESRGVEQVGELRRVAVEVRLQHPADAADGAVALLLVEELIDHATEGAPVAEELLQRPRQPAVAVGEVRPERLLERGSSPLVDLLRLADEALELALHDVDVDRHAGVLERDEPDPKRAFDERGPVVARALGEEGGQCRIGDGQALDDDPVPVHADASGQRRRFSVGGGGGGRERADGGFHDPNGGGGP